MKQRHVHEWFSVDEKHHLLADGEVRTADQLCHGCELRRIAMWCEGLLALTVFIDVGINNLPQGFALHTDLIIQSATSAMIRLDALRAADRAKTQRATE